MKYQRTHRSMRRRPHLESLERRRLLAAVGPQSSSDSDTTEVAVVSDVENDSLSTQQNDKGNGKGKGNPGKSGIVVSPINPTSQGLVTSELETTAEFEVVLASQPIADVTIELESSDPTEGVVNITSLTFTPTDWNQPKTVLVTGVQDAEFDGAVDYQILISPAASQDPNYNGLNPDDVSLTNLDDDSQAIYISGFEAITRTRGKRTEVQFVVDVRIDSGNFGVADAGDVPAAGAVVVVSVYDSDPTDLNGPTNIRNFVGTTDENGTFRTYWDRIDPEAFRAEVHDVSLAGHLWDPYDMLEMSFDDDDDDSRPDLPLPVF